MKRAKNFKKKNKIIGNKLKGVYSNETINL